MKQVFYSMMLVAALLLIGSFYFNQTEGWSYTDSFYFSTMTLTTVGYGDLVPSMPHTKMFTAFYTLIGIGAMLYVLGSVTNVIIHVKTDNIKQAIYRYLHKKTVTEEQRELGNRKKKNK